LQPAVVVNALVVTETEVEQPVMPADGEKLKDTEPVGLVDPVNGVTPGTIVAKNGTAWLTVGVLTVVETEVVVLVGKTSKAVMDAPLPAVKLVSPLYVAMMLTPGEGIAWVNVNGHFATPDGLIVTAEHRTLATVPWENVTLPVGVPVPVTVAVKVTLSFTVGYAGEFENTSAV